MITLNILSLGTGNKVHLYGSERENTPVRGRGTCVRCHDRKITHTGIPFELEAVLTFMTNVSYDDHYINIATVYFIPGPSDGGFFRRERLGELDRQKAMMSGKLGNNLNGWESDSNDCAKYLLWINDPLRTHKILSNSEY